MLQAALKKNAFVEEENLHDYERMIKEKKAESRKEKALHGEFVQQTSDVAGEEFWRWLWNGFLKRRQKASDTSSTGTSLENKLDQAQRR